MLDHMRQNRGSAKTDGFCLCADAVRITQSGLCNPETSFLTPFVDFQRGDLHISDYIIRSLYIISRLCTPKPSIQNCYQHPSG